MAERHMTSVRLERTIDAPPGIVWDVITDHELYAEAAPNLSTVEVVDGAAETMVRRCVDTNGNAWTERCTRWEDGRGFAVSVDVENSDFHRRLFSRFDGEWRLSEMADGVVVSIQFDFDTRFGPLGWLLARYFAWKAPSLVEAIFDRWEAEIAARSPGFEETTGSTQPTSPTRSASQ